MVALVVSSILLLGVAKIYTSSKHSSKVNNDFAVLQEAGRIAMNYLVRDIRMAGFMGCVFNNGGPQFQCYLNSTNNFICGDFKTGLVGYNFTGTEADASNTATAYTLAVDTATPPKLKTGDETADWKNAKDTGLPTGFPAGAVAGSDVIIVKHGTGSSFPLANDNNSQNLQINALDSTVAASGSKSCNQKTGICAGDIMLVSDCNKSAVFQVSQLASSTAAVLNITHNNSGNPTPGNSKTIWANTTTDAYSKNDSEVMEYQTWAYYIANNQNGEPALYRQDGIAGDQAQELVEGIENMQILYGIDTSGDGTANYYASADQVDFTDTAKPVVSIRISLLVRSKNPLPKRPVASNTYTLATAKITNASDQRLRKIFTTTIKIRNKGGSL